MEKQRQPYHYQPDSLENFYLNERIEEAERKNHFKKADEGANHYKKADEGTGGRT